MPAILAKKLGMTQLFLEDGRVERVTVLEAGPCPVTGIRTHDRDGYEAVQLAFGATKEKHLSKAELGHLRKAGAPPMKHVVEFRDEAGEHVAPLAAPVAEQARRRARRGLVEARGVEDRERVALGVHGEHAAQRGAALLAVDLEGVVARRGAEDDAAAGEVRRADRALAGAAGALLAPRLRAAATDVAARLRRGRALPAGVELRADRLVDERAVEARAERRVVEVDGLRAAEDGSASHRCAPPPRRCAGRGPSRAP